MKLIKLLVTGLTLILWVYLVSMFLISLQNSRNICERIGGTYSFPNCEFKRIFKTKGMFE